ncbi:MAG: DUF1467 family protein [Rhodospirillales bacterium]|nr:MAG: DUF1467 family protein [Rhodospirillales bacterium]
MGWLTGIAVFIVVWWIVIFAVLPWGVRPVEADDVAKGHMHGAPQRPRLLLKMALTTLVAVVVWAIIYVIVVYSGLTFRT